ncbi:MAG: RidA family protein, partial [Bryobacteraceae bacterium]
MVERIYPAGAPAPRGPYAPAVRAGAFIFVAGQGPVDPVTNEMSCGDIQHETRVTLDNVRRILEAAGATVADVVRCGVFLKYAEDFAAMNAVYAEFFGET